MNHNKIKGIKTELKCLSEIINNNKHFGIVSKLGKVILHSPTGTGLVIE